MHQKHRLLLLLSILDFWLIGVGQSIGYAQSVTKAKPDSWRIEAQTLKQKIARRRRGEPDTSFLRHVLPVSYPCTYTNPCTYNSHIVSYAWRPTPFGKQLFFSNPNSGDEKDDLVLFVLDPFKANTYAVQAFNMGQMSDLTIVKAIFFTDINQDGQKELISLNECDLKEGFKDDNGKMVYGRAAHYNTCAIKYIGLDAGGHPQYRKDQTPRAYLDELPTAAAVRQAIRQH